MITQTEFIKRHKEYLNEKFVEDHPEGQFVIQRRREYVNIYVNFKRRTSASHPIYPNAFGVEHCNIDGFYFITSQNNSFGKVTIYKTLDKFLITCKRFLVKEESVREFLFFYNNRNVPGFVDEVQRNIYFSTKIHKSTVPSRKNSIWERYKGN